MQVEPHLSPYTQFKFKWIKDLNIKSDILNLLKEKQGKNFELIGTGHNFVNKTQEAQAIKSTIDKWALIKLKSFYKATKDAISKKKK